MSRQPRNTNAANASTANAATLTPPKVNKSNAPKPKVKKANPTKDARRDMLKSIKDDRASFTTCLREVCGNGGKWIALIGLDAKKVKALRPNELEQYQLESEMWEYKAVDASGQLVKVRKGFTPSRVANAIERMAKALSVAPPSNAL